MGLFYFCVTLLNYMWLEITEADLLTRMSGPELAAFRAAALGAGQDDPIAPTITSAVNVVRGYIAACQRNIPLGPENTVPDKLVNATLALIVIDIQSRAAGKVIDPQGIRKEAADKATALLRDVAGCRFAIEKPQEITDEVILIPDPSIKATRIRHYGREHEIGL